MHPAAVEDRFRTGTERLRGWGFGLLALAAILWGYAAWQLLTPYELHHPNGDSTDCTAPAFADREDVYSGGYAYSGERHCAAARDWPKPVAALVLATPLATAGGVLLAIGSVSGRLRQHEADLDRARG